MYNVPAKRGQRVTYVSEKGHKPDKVGVITSACRGYLRIRFDGDIKTYPSFFHPTWNIVYHDSSHQKPSPGAATQKS